MYFKTCFVPTFDRVIGLARVLLENLKKLDDHSFLENSILVLQILSYLRNY